MVAAVDKEMEAFTMGIQLTPEEKFEIFGPNYSEDYETEAEQRWGDTDAWKQSQQRTADADQAAVDRDQGGGRRPQPPARRGHDRRRRSGQRGGDGPGRGAPQGDRDLLRLLADMHRHLGDMYVQDERFTRTYDDVAPGLAQWLRDAIHANADRADAAEGGI